MGTQNLSPNGQPRALLEAEVRLRGLVARVWQMPGTAHPNQDRWIATAYDDMLRVAAIDGVTPWQSRAWPGKDAAQAAAATVAGYLLLPLPLRDAMAAANASLHNPVVRPSRRQAMAAVAVADCRSSRAGVDANILVAADCEVWTADCNGGLTLTAGGSSLHLNPSRVGQLPEGKLLRRRMCWRLRQKRWTTQTRNCATP